MSLRLGEIIIAGAGQTSFIVQPSSGTQGVRAGGLVRSTSGDYFFNISNQQLSIDSTETFGNTAHWERVYTSAEVDAAIQAAIDALTPGQNLSAADIKRLYESNADTNDFTDAEKSKLAGIESGAQVNVGVEFTQTEKTKLGAIEEGAQRNPTAAEIKTEYESNHNTNAFTDAEQQKLGGLPDNDGLNNLLDGKVDEPAGAPPTFAAILRRSEEGTNTWANEADYLGGGSGGGATNLGSVENTDSVEITSSTGRNATIPSATSTAAGVLSSADKQTLDALSNFTVEDEGTALPGGTRTINFTGTGVSVVNAADDSEKTVTINLPTGQAQTITFESTTSTTYADALTAFITAWGNVTSGQPFMSKNGDTFDIIRTGDRVILTFGSPQETDLAIYEGPNNAPGASTALVAGDFIALDRESGVSKATGDTFWLELDGTNANQITDAGAIRSGLGLGTAAESATTDFVNVSDTTGFGRGLINEPNAADARTVLQAAPLTEFNTLVTEVKHNTSHVNTIDGELQTITHPTGQTTFGTALGGNWGTLEAYYEDATRTVTVTTTDPDGLPDAWENLNNGTLLYGFGDGVTPATDGSDNSSFRVEVTNVGFQQVRLRAADDASNTFLTGLGTLSFGIRDYTDAQENTLFGGLRTASVAMLSDALVQSGTDGSLTRVAIGNNLTLSNGTLSATGTSGGGGGDTLFGAPVGIDLSLPVIGIDEDLVFNVRVSVAEAVASGVSFSWAGVNLTGGPTSLSAGQQTITLTLAGTDRASLSENARSEPPVMVIGAEQFPITTIGPEVRGGDSNVTAADVRLFDADNQFQFPLGNFTATAPAVGQQLHARFTGTNAARELLDFGNREGQLIRVVYPADNAIPAGGVVLLRITGYTANSVIGTFVHASASVIAAATQLQTPLATLTVSEIVIPGPGLELNDNGDEIYVEHDATLDSSGTGILRVSNPAQDSAIGIGGGDGVQIQDDVLIPSSIWEYLTVSSGSGTQAVTFAGTEPFPVPGFAAGIGVNVVATTQEVNASPIQFTFTDQQYGEQLITPAIDSGTATTVPPAPARPFRTVTTTITLSRPLDDGDLSNITSIGSFNGAVENNIRPTAYDDATRVLTIDVDLNQDANGGIDGGLDVEIVYGIAFVHNRETFTLPNRAYDATSQAVTVTRNGNAVAHTFTIEGDTLTVTLDNVSGSINSWQGGDIVGVTYNQAIEGDTVAGTIGTIADPAGTTSQVINFASNFNAGGADTTYSIRTQGRMVNGDGQFTLNQNTNENFGFTVDYEAGGFNNLPAIVELRNEIEQLRLGRSALTDTSSPFGFVPYPNGFKNNDQTGTSVPTNSSLRFSLPATTNDAFGELSFTRQYQSAAFRGRDIILGQSMFYGGNQLGRNIGASLFNPMHRAIFRGNQINWATTGGSTIHRGTSQIVDGGSTTSIFRTMEYVLTYGRQYDEEIAARFHPSTVPTPGQPLNQVAGFENFTGWGFGITAEELGRSTIWTSERDPNTNDRVGYNEFIVCFGRGDRTINPSMAIDSCLALRRRFKYTDGELTGDNPLNRPLTTYTDVGRYVASNFADYYEIVGGSMPVDFVIPDVAGNDFWMQIFLLEPALSAGFQPGNFRLEQGTQFGRHEIERFSGANQWTGVKFKYFQDPNVAGDYSGTANADAQARPEINMLRLYENAALTSGPEGGLQRIKTGWDAAPTFDPNDVTGRNSRLGITYSRESAPGTVVRESVDKDIPTFGNTQVSERQSVNLPFNQSYEYLNILVLNGDNEISSSGRPLNVATNLEITEIYDAQNGFPDDLHVLSHQRIDALRRQYPLPIEDTWLPDNISSDIVLHPATQQIDEFTGDGQRTVFRLSQFPNAEVTVAFVSGGTATTQTTGFTYDAVQNEYTFTPAPTDIVRFTYNFENRATTENVLLVGATAADSEFFGNAANGIRTGETTVAVTGGSATIPLNDNTDFTITGIGGQAQTDAVDSNSTIDVTYSANPATDGGVDANGNLTINIDTTQTGQTGGNDGRLPTPTTGNYIRGNAAADGWENRTAAQVLGDINAIGVEGTQHQGIRNTALLTGGFLLTEMAATSGQDANRDRYNGAIAGFAAQDYWFDNSDDSWYDVETGGTALISFT